MERDNVETFERLKVENGRWIDEAKPASCSVRMMMTLRWRLKVMANEVRKLKIEGWHDVSTAECGHYAFPVERALLYLAFRAFRRLGMRRLHLPCGDGIPRRMGMRRLQGVVRDAATTGCGTGCGDYKKERLE
jgi:hypothetical protein